MDSFYKVVIYNYVFMLALIRVKFDCIFVQSFLYIFVGFNVRVVCESLVKIYEEGDFMSSS